MTVADIDSKSDQADLLTEVVEALNMGVAMFDENAVMTYCNAAFRSMENGEVADLLRPGLGWDMMQRELVRRGVIAAPTSERFRIMEAQLGTDVEVPPLDFEMPQGRIVRAHMRQASNNGYILFVRDVTVHRKLAENAHEADELLEKVLEACPASVVMSRVGDGQILYRSPAATELLGTTRHAHEHFASRAERADFVTALLPNGRVDDMTITGLRPDRTRFPSLISARMIDYRGEEVMVSTIVDISKEVALRRTLAEQREKIFQAEKMSALGELLAGVAHELNNPLSVVVGHALMLKEESIDPEILRRVEKISDAAERCTGIVKSFLAMARQQPVQLVPMDLRETIEMAVDALENGADGLATRVEITGDTKLPMIRGDTHQLAQVIINLITNADQAVRDSGTGDLIRLSLSHNEAERTIELVVADNGPGVPNAIQRRIFDPLFTTKAVGSGTGLGLALAHRIIEAHDGQMRIDPDCGTGASFRITLPVTMAETQPRTGEPAVASSRAQSRILVVDDEEEVAALIREILVRDGYSVEAVSSAEAALEKVQTQEYAVILTDLNMPGLGGRGLYEALLRDHPDHARRVGFVTGDTMSPQVRGFLDGVGRPFIEKPIAPSDLRRLTSRMLNMKVQP